MQQDRFIKYYTTLSVQTINARLINAVQFTTFASKLVFMNTLFKAWNVSDGSKVLRCTDINMNINIDALDKLRTFGTLHNSPVLRNQSVSSYFTSDSLELSMQDKEDITNHFGGNINSLDYILKNTALIGASKTLSVILMLILTNTANAEDYKGIFFDFPGTCGDVEFYSSKVSRLS